MSLEMVINRTLHPLCWNFFRSFWFSEIRFTYFSNPPLLLCLSPSRRWTVSLNKSPSWVRSCRKWHACSSPSSKHRRSQSWRQWCQISPCLLAVLAPISWCRPPPRRSLYRDMRLSHCWTLEMWRVWICQDAFSPLLIHQKGLIWLTPRHRSPRPNSQRAPSMSMLAPTLSHLRKDFKKDLRSNEAPMLPPVMGVFCPRCRTTLPCCLTRVRPPCPSPCLSPPRHPFLPVKDPTCPDRAAAPAEAWSLRPPPRTPFLPSPRTALLPRHSPRPQEIIGWGLHLLSRSSPPLSPSTPPPSPCRCLWTSSAPQGGREMPSLRLGVSHGCGTGTPGPSPVPRNWRCRNGADSWRRWSPPQSRSASLMKRSQHYERAKMSKLQVAENDGAVQRRPDEQNLRGKTEWPLGGWDTSGQ